MMWWKDIVNRYAHGVPMPWHVSIMWRCERCGGPAFRVLSWDKWDESRGTVRRFALECVACDAVEANIVETIEVW